jgi:hypothetical protein
MQVRASGGSWRSRHKSENSYIIVGTAQDGPIHQPAEKDFTFEATCP